MYLPDVSLLAPERPHEGPDRDATNAVDGNASLQYSLDRLAVINTVYRCQLDAADKCIRKGTRFNIHRSLLPPLPPDWSLQYLYPI